MKLANLLLCLPALLVSTACQSAGTPRSENAAPAGSGKAEDAEGAADKTLKKEREVEYARLELEISKLSVAADTREAEAAVLEATQKLEAAKKDRDDFKGRDKPNKLADNQLDIDRAAWRMEESRQELGELEGMYKKEDFAELTKELVLSRGKKNLEFAQRSLEIAKKDQEGLTSHELPKRETELDQAVQRAEKGLDEARSKKDRTAVEVKLKLLKAEHRVEEAQRELEKTKSKDKDKGKSEPKAAEA